MKRRMLSLGIHLVLISILVTSNLTSCVTNSEEPDNTANENPPEMPPMTSFIIDFDNFSRSDLPVNLDINDLGVYSNWGYAALNVSLWSLTGTFSLAVPLAAFVESFQQTAVQQSDKSWLWLYNYDVQETTYRANLIGKYNPNDTVSWEMHITKQNEYLDFLWYYGESNLSATDGYWIIKDKPTNPFDLLRIDWHWNNTTETIDIRYANIFPDGADNGKYIYFTMRLGGNYNCSFEIYNYQREGNRIDIEWNNMTKTGCVRDLSRFGELNWHCWDSNLKNTTGW